MNILLFAAVMCGTLWFTYRLGRASERLDQMLPPRGAEVVDLESRRQMRALQRAVERHPSGRDA